MAIAKSIREQRLMPDRIPRYVRVYDNGGADAANGTLDRYTIVFTGHWPGRKPGDNLHIGSSERPAHPQGFYQHGESREPIDRPSYKHLGRKIKFSDLPTAVRVHICDDYRKLWEIPFTPPQLEQHSTQ